MPYMVTFTINIPQMLEYIPHMDPMGIFFKSGPKDLWPLISFVAFLRVVEVCYFTTAAARLAGPPHKHGKGIFCPPHGADFPQRYMVSRWFETDS